MEFEIKIKDEEYDKIITLMNNIDSLNKGCEIGAWLLGDWTITEDKATLILDKFIIPKQEVSKTEVDISPASMTDTIKKVGIEESNRIKAHWHIHPFGKGDTSWSSIDESKIEDFMEPTKGREIFVFLLSSEDKIKARVVINSEIKNNFLGIHEIQTESMDNLPVRRCSEVQIDYTDFLKKEIKDNVKVEEYKYTGKSGFYGGYGSYGEYQRTFKEENSSLSTYIKNDKVEEELCENSYYFSVEADGKEVKASLTDEFFQFVKKNNQKSELWSTVIVKNKKFHEMTWTLKSESKAKKKEKILKKMFLKLEDDFIEDKYGATEEKFKKQDSPRDLFYDGFQDYLLE